MAHQAEFVTLQANVVTISFGTAYWSQVWLQETGSPFPFLIDADRVAYHAYGLESSVFRSWSPANLWYYTRAVMQKRETFGKRGNPHQLGGDFIIDPQGIVRLAHPSREPTDRPSLNEVWRALQQINAQLG
ncbi:MAG: redoxin domain-containing protein [Chloroflexi bacterium]|nr:redoxin domain-containing protein [Chloroflexota bacterium]